MKDSIHKTYKNRSLVDCWTEPRFSRIFTNRWRFKWIFFRKINSNIPYSTFIWSCKKVQTLSSEDYFLKENDLHSRGPPNLTINSLRPDMSVTWCFDSILPEQKEERINAETLISREPVQRTVWWHRCLFDVCQVMVSTLSKKEYRKWKDFLSWK